MKVIIAVIFSGLLLLSCNREQLCHEAEESTIGEVVKITGPDTLSLGTTVALIVEVATNDRFCAKRADGFIVDVTGNNYLQIGAHLIHSGAKNKSCDCVNETTIKTLIYFTPNKAGGYTFGSKPADISTGNNAPTDTNNYHVFVH